MENDKIQRGLQACTYIKNVLREIGCMIEQTISQMETFEREIKQDMMEGENDKNKSEKD